MVQASQDAMAKASTAVSGRLFSITASGTLIRQSSFQQLSSASIRLRNKTTDLTIRRLITKPLCDLGPPTFRTSSYLVSPLRARQVLGQTRCFASQTDGLGQSETFKEYRLRERIEQRRRALRALEDDLLRSQVKVADARFQLNLQELASLPV